MGLSDYSAERLLVYVNGQRITEWGEGAPITFTQARAKTTIKRGYGTKHVKSRVTDQGCGVKLNIIPGGRDAKKVKNIADSGVDIEIEVQVIGTDETHLMSEGVYQGYDPRERGADKPSDDGFLFDFAKDYSSLGGES